MIEKGDYRFCTFERKAPLTDKLAMQKGFKSGCLEQHFHGLQLFLTAKIGAIACFFRLLLEPLAFVRTLDMGEFKTE